MLSNQTTSTQTTHPLTDTSESPALSLAVRPTRRFRIRRDPLAIFGACVFLLFVVFAIFAPWIAPYSPLQQDLTMSLQGPSSSHWLGTDNYGRDLLSRVIYGSRVSIVVGLLAVAIAMIVGGVLGLLAGVLLGPVELIIMRFVDILLAFPTLLIALLIVAIFRPSIWVVIIAVGLSTVPNFARLVRAEVLAVREREFVTAARAIGVSEYSLATKHILPNLVSSMLVMGTALLAGAILTESNLSFLGLGVPQDVTSWGGMINEGRTYLLSNPLVPILPGLAIMLMVAGVNFIGDYLRDILDPRLKRE